MLSDFVRKLLFSLVLLLGLAPPGRAQTWLRDPLLGRLLIHQMAQDSVGLLWVASDDGVFRYDGYSLVPLGALTDDALPVGFAAQTLLFDQQQLWIGSTQGLFCLRGRQLRQVRLPSVGTAPVNVSLLARHPRTHDLWASYGAHLARLPGGKLPARAVPTGLAAPVAWLAPTGSEAMWLSSARHEVSYVTPSGGHRKAYQPDRALVPLPDTQPLQLLGSNALYEETPAGTLRELKRWLPGPDVNNFLPGRTPGGWQWVVNRQLVQLSQPAAGQPPQVQLQPADFERAGQLSRQYTVFVDAGGRRWCTSAGQRGCFKERRAAASISPVPSRPLPSYSTRAIVRLPDGRLLVGAYGAALVQPADSPAAPLRPLPLHEAGQSSEAVLLDVLPPLTASEPVVFAEESHPFGLLDTRSGQLRRLAWARSPAEFTGSLCVLRDRRGQLWGGTTRGLYVLDAQKALATRYAKAPALDSQEIYDVQAGPDNQLWLATKRGLFRLDPATGRLQPYGLRETGPNHLPTDDLLCVWPDPAADAAWVGSRDQGLLLVQAGRGLQRQLTTASGLPSNTVASILPGQKDELWCGTYAGLVRYQPRTGQLVTLTEADGLTDAEMNRQSAHRDADGTLYFGGVGGVYRVRGAMAAATVQPVPCLLLTAYTQHLSARDTTRTYYLPGRLSTPLVLAPHDAFLELSLALTDYLAPEQARFQYRLLGSGDKRWRNLGNAHAISFQGLPAGEYEVEVRGHADNGVAARNRLRLPLLVQAVWWRQPWVWLLTASAVAATLYGLHRRRLARVRAQERLRSRIAADLHDEVGTMLTRVSMQAQLLAELPPHEQPPALSRLVRNSQAAAGTMRDIVWGIDARADTTGALLDRMRDYLDQTAALAGLATFLDTPGLEDQRPLPPEVRQHIYLIFKEAVANVVRHAPQATELRVQLTRQAGQLHLSVSNDGPAPASTGRSGMGLRNMQQRAEMLRGTFAAGPGAAGGFAVQLVVPV